MLERRYEIYIDVLERKAPKPGQRLELVGGPRGLSLHADGQELDDVERFKRVLPPLAEGESIVLTVSSCELQGPPGPYEIILRYRLILENAELPSPPFQARPRARLSALAEDLKRLGSGSLLNRPAQTRPAPTLSSWR